MKTAAAADIRCKHCGTRFRPTAERPEFCCAGCQFVHGLIVGRGLGQFYDLQDSELFPVKSTVFQHRDFAWLADLAAASPDGRLKLDLQGISCLGCVWLVEKLFSSKPGALRIRVDSTLGELEWWTVPGVFDAPAFAAELQRFGYLLGPPDPARKRPSGSLAIRMGVCAALAMNAMLFSLPAYLGLEAASAWTPVFASVAFGCGTLSLLVGGTYFIERSLRSLSRGVLHIDLPIALGLIAAWIGSVIAWRSGWADFLYFDFVSIFTFLMLLGRWVQQRAVQSNRQRLLGGGLHVATPVAGTTYEVGRGEVVPVRSILRSRAAVFSLEWINGEPEAVTAPEGRVVPAGAIHLGKTPVALEALESWGDSILARLLGTPSETDDRDPALERFIRCYLAVVLAVAAIASSAWWLAGVGGLAALQVLTSILVVSCPCAVGVALPLAEDLAAAALKRVGIFVRNPRFWHRMPRIRRVAFDKTGTLTMETMAVRNPEALARLTALERSVLLAMVADNLHPVSCALREHLLASGVSPVPLESCEEIVGTGLEAFAFGSAWTLARPADPSPDFPQETEFRRDGKLLAATAFAEDVRPDAAAEIARLERAGRRVHILSGDRPHKVRAMAEKLGLPPARALGALTPDEKAEWVRAFDAGDTLMIGDGANDALAFAAASCTGTPAIDRGLLEKRADFYFLGRSLRAIGIAFRIAGLRRAAARGVTGFAIAYNAIAVSLSAAGAMNPLLAAILMPVSSLVTTAIVLITLRDRAPR